MGVHYLRSYAEEYPDIKFILTERDDESESRIALRTSSFTRTLSASNRGNPALSESADTVVAASWGVERATASEKSALPKQPV